MNHIYKQLQAHLVIISHYSTAFPLRFLDLESKSLFKVGFDDSTEVNIFKGMVTLQAMNTLKFSVCFTRLDHRLTDIINWHELYWLH